MCFPQATANQAAATSAIPSRSMAAVQQRAQAATRLDQSPTVFTSPLGIQQPAGTPRPINKTILTGSL